MKVLQVLVIIALFTVNMAAQDVWAGKEVGDYTINYPSKWELADGSSFGVKFLLFAPLIQSKSDFKSNINIVIQDLSAYDLDLAAFTELSVKQVNTLITDVEIEKNETKQGKTTAVAQLVYVGEQGTLKLKWHQYFWLKDKSAYVFTFTSEIDSYDTHIDEVKQIFDTLGL